MFRDTIKFIGVRGFAILIGAAFAGVLLISMVVNLVGAIQSPTPASVEEEFHVKHPEPLKLASDGPFGKFDKAQLQRGFQVYKEVCSACHSLSRVHFYDLKALGYDDGQIKTLAATYQIPVYNAHTGETDTHAGLPSDAFPPVAYGGQGTPPDLSLITKAREGGATYVHALLTGYRNQPTELLKRFPDAKTPEGLHYNPVFANLNIAMPPPLTSDGQVTYAEGNPPATIDQMSKDVSAFLVWTAEPKLENRHITGLSVMVFLLFATVLGFMAYKNVWSGVKGGHAEPETAPAAPKAAAAKKKAPAKKKA